MKRKTSEPQINVIFDLALAAISPKMFKAIMSNVVFSFLLM